MTDLMIADGSSLYRTEEDDGRHIFLPDRKVNFAANRMTTVRAKGVFGGAIEMKRALRQSRQMHQSDRGAKLAVGSVDGSNATDESPLGFHSRQALDLGNLTVSTSISLTLGMAEGFSAGYRIIYTAPVASAIRFAGYPRAYAWLGYVIFALIAAGLIASLIRPPAISDLGVPTGFTLWAIAAYLIRRRDKTRLDA